jgi:hypothetical protein
MQIEKQEKKKGRRNVGLGSFNQMNEKRGITAARIPWQNGVAFR